MSGFLNDLRSFHDASPIGRQIDFGGKKYTIVGVVPSIKYAKLSQPPPPATIYLNAFY
jgi:hypothetical protein